MNVQLALLILAVRDLPRAVTFYRTAFGWSLTVDDTIYAEFLLPNNQRVGLYTREGFGGNVGQMPVEVQEGQLTGTEVYLYVDDMPEVLTHLEQAGARKLSDVAVRAWGDEAAYFADLDGHVLVVAQVAGTHSTGE